MIEKQGKNYPGSLQYNMVGCLKRINNMNNCIERMPQIGCMVSRQN